MLISKEMEGVGTLRISRVDHDFVYCLKDSCDLLKLKLGNRIRSELISEEVYLLCKDLSKADVSVNIYAFLKAQKTGKVVELSCAIGDEFIDGKPYGEIVCIAKEYIKSIGGFEKFAEWGLIRP